MNIFLKKYYLLLFALLLSTGYFIFLFERSAEYHSFETLTWNKKSGCSSEVSRGFDGTSRTLKFDFDTNESESSRCSSEAFFMPSPVIRMHYYHPGTGDLLIRLEGDGVPVSESRLENSASSSWSVLQIDIPPSETGREFTLTVVPDTEHTASLHIRSRIEFLSKRPSSLRMGLQDLDKTTFVKSLILGSSLFLIFLYLLKCNFISTCAFFSLLFFSVATLFFTKTSFYYFDEWHVLQRFAEKGISGIWFSHNEHFLPIFFAWYYAVTSVFGESYEALLFLTLILHVLHGVVIVMLLQEFAFSRKVSQIVVFLYSLSALHLEVLEWAFEQSIIICSIFGLLGIVSGSRYIRTGKPAYVLLSAFLCLCAPLIFGNGFTWVPISLVLLCASIFLLDRDAIRVKMLRLGTLGLVQYVLLLPAVYMYIQNKASNAPTDSRSAPFMLLLEKYDQVINYIIVGSGVGTILRGFGVYPNLSLSSLREVSSVSTPSLIPYLDRSLLFSKSLEFHLGIVGYLLLLILFFFSLKTGHRKRAFFSLIASVVILFFSFLLPALGRISFGELQSLALRYQYQALLGVLMILVSLGTRMEFLSSKGSFVGKSVNVLGVGIVFIWLQIQVCLFFSFNYFRYHGEVHKIYIDSLEEWGKFALKSKEIPYEGEGDANGLFPVHYPGITPGTHPRDILNTYRWLSDSKVHDES